MNLPGFGPEQQERLHNSHVLVIGAGGLGCPIMQTLAATGVGHITVWDDDTVDLTNIHRQILFGAQDVGRRKVDVAAERLRALQPDIQVTAVNDRLTPDNFLEALEGIDLLIDGSDTFATKFLAADAAEITGTPLMWGSVLRYRGDIALWWSGPGAPAHGVGLRDLYPTQPDADSVPDCATAGVLGVTTSVVGSLMSTEAVKFLAGIGDVHVGRLHMYDALTTTMRQFTVARDPARPLASTLGTYIDACAAPSTEGQQLFRRACGSQPPLPRRARTPREGDRGSPRTGVEPAAQRGRARPGGRGAGAVQLLPRRRRGGLLCGWRALWPICPGAR